MPRKRHVSRNANIPHALYHGPVMPRKRHVSRNIIDYDSRIGWSSHASQEACE